MDEDDTDREELSAQEHDKEQGNDEEKEQQEDGEQSESDMPQPKPKPLPLHLIRKFNSYDSTDSELDYEDLFSSKLVNLIQRDFSRLNLQLLKGIIMKPEVKQSLKESDHFKDGIENIPITLEEHMLRQKIQLE